MTTKRDKGHGTSREQNGIGNGNTVYTNHTGHTNTNHGRSFLYIVAGRVRLSGCDGDPDHLCLHSHLSQDIIDQEPKFFNFMTVIRAETVSGVRLVALCFPDPSPGTHGKTLNSNLSSMVVRIQIVNTIMNHIIFRYQKDK